MYQNRKELYKKLEENRKSKVIVYVTGDRRSLETRIHQEVLDFFVHHLDLIRNVPKISLYLYTTGGDTLAAWSIVNLIRQFCEDLEVIIPSKAHSAGTLICLGANNIVMTKQATLSPIDPSLNTPLNPQVPGAPPAVRYPVSVEAINGFIELAREELKISTNAELTSVLGILAANVHPLVLGQVYRTRSQIRMLGRRLLQKHKKDGEEKIEKLLDFLCSESGSHDYTIYRQEARESLGLNVMKPDDELYSSIMEIYDDIIKELELNAPFDPNLLLKGQSQVSYNLKRAVIESIDGGSHKFFSEGQLAKKQMPIPNSGLMQDVLQDIRTYEGWKHESV